MERPGSAQRGHRHVTLLPSLEEVLVDILRGRVQLLLLRSAQQPLYLVTAGSYVIINLPPPLGSSANKTFFLQLFLNKISQSKVHTELREETQRLILTLRKNLNLTEGD